MKAFIVLASERFNDQTDYALLFISDWQKDEYVRGHNLDASNLVNVPCDDRRSAMRRGRTPVVGVLVWPCCGCCRPTIVVFDDEASRDAHSRSEDRFCVKVAVVDGSVEFTFGL